MANAHIIQAPRRRFTALAVVAALVLSAGVFGGGAPGAYAQGSTTPPSDQLAATPEGESTPGDATPGEQAPGETTPGEQVPGDGTTPGPEVAPESGVGTSAGDEALSESGAETDTSGGGDDGEGATVSGADSLSGGDLKVEQVQDPPQIPQPHGAPSDEPFLPPQAAAAPVPTIWEQEPNDTTAQAQTLPLGAVLGGSFGRTGRSDSDVYKITSPKAGRLVIDFRFASTLGVSGSVRLKVIDAVGNEIENYGVGSADYTGERLRQYFIPVASGVTYLQLIKDYYSVFSDQPYTLKATVTPMAVEIEPNDTTRTANAVPFGVRVHGTSKNVGWSSTDYDYFRFAVNQRTKLNLDFFASCAFGTERPYSLSVYDNAGDELWSKKLGGPECRGFRSTVTVPKGNVYLMVAVPYSRLAVGKEYSFIVGQAMTEGTPTISGSAVLGGKLVAKPGSWGPGAVKFGYQWYRSGKAISGATKSSYTVTKADIGRKISVRVSGSKSGYIAATKMSSAKLVKTTFADVLISHKFYGEIQWMYDSGISKGTRSDSGLMYHPKSTVTREAMAAFLFRQYAKPGYKPRGQHFADVPKSHRFYTAIEWMYTQGISTGTKVGGQRYYYPADGVSRQAMAAFLFRLSGPKGTAAPRSAPFVDVAPNHKFAKAIAWMKSTKLSTGSRTPSGAAYLPSDPVSREAMAAFLYRMQKRLIEKN